MKKKPLSNKSGHVRELKKEDFKAMRPASKVLPEKLLSVLPKRKRGERGPQKAATKISVTLRYTPEVLEYFKSTGQGWQTLMDSVLKGYVKRHQKPTKRTTIHSKHSFK